MLEKIRYVLMLCLITILLPSYGCGMEITEPPEKRRTPIKQSQQNAPTIKLPSKKWPRHFQYLIVKYGGNRQVSPVPENEGLVEERTQYQDAFKYYVRAQTNLNPENPPSVTELNNRKKTFQTIQRKALFKHSSLRVIERIKKTKEDADLSVDFKDEIEDMEYILCPFFFTTNPYDPTILKDRPQGDKSPSKCTKQTIPCYYLEQQDLNLATEQLKRFISYMKRVIKIQKSVWVLYYEYYILENIRWRSLEQNQNWWYDTKRIPTLEIIKKHIEEKYPYDAYKLQLLDKEPTNGIGSNKLALYLKNKELFLKVKNKGEIAIKALEETSNLFFGPKVKDKITIYERFCNVLTSGGKITPSMEDQWLLIEFASISGYLPDDFSPKEMSRIKKDRTEVLNILRDKPIGYWEWVGNKWERNPGPPDTINKEDNGLTEEELDKLYDALPKFVEPKANIPLIGWKRITEGWVNLALDLKPEWDNKRIAYELEAFKYKQLHMAHRINNSVSIYFPHRKKMIYVLNELHRKPRERRKSTPEEEKKGNSKIYFKPDLEKYILLYNECEKFINIYIDQEFVLNTPYSYFSRIPVCLEFFQSEHYMTQLPIEELDLSNSNLSEENFYRLVKPENSLISTKVEKMRKDESVLTRYKTINLLNNNISYIPMLASLPNLTDLNVSCNNLNLTLGLSSAKFFSTLTSLDISYIPTSNAYWISSQLKNFTALRVLNLSGNKKLFDGEYTKTVWSSLANLPSLHSLTTTDCGLSGNWKQLFPIGLDKLVTFDVRENPSIIFPPKGDLNDIFPSLKNLKTDKGEFTWQ